MYGKDKKEVEKKFENADLKEEKKIRQHDEITIKCNSIVLPIFNDYQEIFKRQNLTVVREDKYHLTVTRGNVSFYIKCNVYTDRIELRWLFEGGGLEPIKSFELDQITRKAITDAFKEFTDYILEWS